MRREVRTEVTRVAGYRFHVIGVPRPDLSDAYHAMLRLPGWAAFVGGVVLYLLLNTLFALAYLVTGGVAGAEAGSFVDAFYFSVQTMGTIGYGSMYPATRLANAVVVAESIAGLVVTALATGVVFARFSQTRSRFTYSRQVAIGPMDGVPTLMIRLGNERRGRIVDVLFRLTMVRTVRTKEGVQIYRNEDLPLVRERATSLTRSWMVLHRITPGSPLHGMTPEQIAASDMELMLQLVGTDDTSLQPVHASNSWHHSALIWGARLADVVRERTDGDVEVDLRRFHDLDPTEPTPEFPYPATPSVALESARQPLA